MKTSILLTEIKGFSTLEALIALTIFGFISVQLLSLLKSELSLNRVSADAVQGEQFAFRTETVIRRFFSAPQRLGGNAFDGTAELRGEQKVQIDLGSRGLRYQGRRLYLNGNEVISSENQFKDTLLKGGDVSKIEDLKFKREGDGLLVTITWAAQGLSHSHEFLIAL